MKLKFSILAIFTALITSAAADAAEPDIATPTPTPVSCESATLAGIEVICLESGVGSFSKFDRAQAVQQRLSNLADDRTFDPAMIKITEDGGVSNFTANGISILSLRSDDLPVTAGKNYEQRTESILQSMRAAIAAQRLLKNPDTFLWGALKTLAASVALIAILLLVNFLTPKLYALVERSEGRYIRSLKIQSFELLNSKRIVAFTAWLIRTIRIIFTLLAFYIYIPLVLSFFPWTERWAPKLFGYVVTPFVTFFTIVIDYVPNIFFIVVISLITRYLLKVIRFFFMEIEQGTLTFNGFYKEWSDPTYKLVRVIVVAFAFVMAFPYLPGAHSPAFQGVSVFLGILLSLGSSSAIGNIVAGVVLTYMRPFKIGDRVQIADTVGDVIEKTLLITRIRSIKHVEITIPNSMVLGSHMVNYSAAAMEAGLILNTSVTIGYDAPWKQIHELLIAAAKRTKNIDADRKPFVYQTALNDFFVSYEINAYTKFPNEMAQTYSNLHQNIQDCFNEAGVEIMSPHFTALRDGSDKAMPATPKT
ncbi:mechanosensitive ion channel family protein [soil metagenome]